MRGRRERAAWVVAASLALAACGGYGDSGQVTTPPALPSGSLGVVTSDAAVAAVRGLCDVRDAPDAPAANATFYDRTHQELHVIAAATEEQDRAKAASLLEAMQRVEAELERPLLPAGFSADVESLVGATREALASIGLDAPGCT
jgi:hypothetical protein